MAGEDLNEACSKAEALATPFSYAPIPARRACRQNLIREDCQTSASNQKALDALQVQRRWASGTTALPCFGTVDSSSRIHAPHQNRLGATLITTLADASCSQIENTWPRNQTGSSKDLTPIAAPTALTAAYSTVELLRYGSPDFGSRPFA